VITNHEKFFFYSGSVKQQQQEENNSLKKINTGNTYVDTYLKTIQGMLQVLNGCNFVISVLFGFRDSSTHKKMTIQDQ